MMDDVHSLNIAEIHELFVSKQISPVDLVRSVLEKLQKLQPIINAFSAETSDLAMNSAKIAETMFLNGEVISNLQGIPISIKDNIDIAYVQSAFGSRLQNHTPIADSPVVSRLKSSGACIVGKTTMTEFGCKASSDSSLTGVTSNPRHLLSTSGGSSSGAAAGVASGITPIAICTDGGGSARIPAAFCGVIGFKPSFGRIPVIPAAAVGDLFHIGIISRDVKDIGSTLELISGRHSLKKGLNISKAGRSFHDLKNPRKPTKIGFFWSLSEIAPDPVIKKSITTSINRLTELGYEVSMENNPFLNLYEVFEPIFLSRARNKIIQNDGYQALLDPEILEEFKRCDLYKDDYQQTSTIKRQELIKDCLKLFKKFDFLACPTVPCLPFSKYKTRPPGSHLLGILEWPSNCILANLTGFPAISIPSGETKGGFPVGLQLIGPPFEDMSVLDFAGQVYKIFNRPFSEYSNIE